LVWHGLRHREFPELAESFLVDSNRGKKVNIASLEILTRVSVEPLHRAEILFNATAVTTNALHYANQHLAICGDIINNDHVCAMRQQAF